MRTENRKRSHHGEAVILFSVGGTTFAIAAGAVEEIRDLSGLEPLHVGYLHGKFSKFKYTLRHEGRTCFVLDAATHFHMMPTRPGRLLLLRDTPAGVLVDGIDRMTEITRLHALPRAFVGEERNWYRGLALLQEEVVPVVKPESFLTRAESTVLNAGAGKVRLAKGAAAV